MTPEERIGGIDIISTVTTGGSMTITAGIQDHHIGAWITQQFSAPLAARRWSTQKTIIWVRKMMVKRLENRQKNANA